MDNVEPPIEAMARTFYEGVVDDHSWPHLHPDERDRWLTAAAHALTAYRDAYESRSETSGSPPRLPGFYRVPGNAAGGFGFVSRVLEQTDEAATPRRPSSPEAGD